MSEPIDPRKLRANVDRSWAALIGCFASTFRAVSPDGLMLHPNQGLELMELLERLVKQEREMAVFGDESMRRGDTEGATILNRHPPLTEMVAVKLYELPAGTRSMKKATDKG